MKIAYDHQIFGWQRFGGISRYFFELANHVAIDEVTGIKSQIVSPLHVNDYLKHAGKTLQIKGLHVPAIRRTGRIYRLINEQLAPMLMRKWGPDILHETYYSKTSVAPLGSKTVLTVFDMIHELYPDFFARWDPTRDEKRAAVARADHIICISENTRQDLVRLLGVPAEKTTVVYLGFALTHSQAAILPEPRKPFLLFVGSRGGYKNFNALLEAYASRPALKNNYDLLAFGGGGFSAKEQGLIANLGLSMAQVRQMGGDDSILAALYRQATLFVYPSLYEGFGIPPLESMSFDCPVACSNTSSIPEVVGNAAVLFDPHQSSLIADALETVTSDKALLTSLRQWGRARVELYSWQECAKQTLEVYRKVLQ